MKFLVRMNVTAVAGILAGGFLVGSPTPVQAQNFLDRLFNPRHYEEQRHREQQRNLQPPEQKKEQVKRRPIRISAPRYFAYRPDALKLISLKKLATYEKPAETPTVSDEKQAESVTEAAAPSNHTPATREPTADPISTGSTPAENSAPSGAIVGETATHDDVADAAPTEQDAAMAAFNDARRHLSSFKLRTYPQIGKAILAYYKEKPGFIWITDGKVNRKAETAMAQMARAEEFGLSSADYKVDPPDMSAEVAAPVLTEISLDESIDGAIGADDPQKALITFEMELSAKVLTYVLDATRGRINANRLSGYHDLPRKKVDLVAALGALDESDDVAAYLQSRNPAGSHFAALVKELAALKQADETDRVDIEPGTLLKPGKSNPELANVVAAIRLRGSDELKATHAETLSAYEGTPDYTPGLVTLVKDFQRENKLTADGIVGRNTIRALVGMSNAEKIRKLELAMERSRWLPGDLGARHIFVNQPAYKVSFLRPNRKPLTMRVVVGKRSNQTSFFIDRLETVEYNPYWGVPLSIIVNEMLPKLNRDPSYLDRAGYEVTTASGRRVSSSSVDWYAVASKSQSVNVRQLPGRSNALGELKILFPNKHAIYMHDTPAKSLFKRDRRAFSHGCIRLHNPRAMAAAVLGKSTDYIASRIARGENDSDPVTVPTPIYVSYFTAWPDDQGTMRFYDDVYGRDAHLTKAIKSTSKSRQKRG